MSSGPGKAPSLRFKANAFITSFRARPSVSNLSALFTRKHRDSSKLTLDEYGQKKYGEKSYGWICCKCTCCNLLWQRPGMRCQGRNCPERQEWVEGDPLTGRAVEVGGHLTWVYGEDGSCRDCKKVEIFQGGETELLQAESRNGETGWVHNKEGCMQWHGNMHGDMWSANVCNRHRGCQEAAEDRFFTVTVASSSR